MKVNVRSNNQVKITPAVKEHIEERVLSMDKLFTRSESIVANVLCKGYDKYTVAEITIPMKNIILRAESKADKLYTAIDLAIDKIEKQLLRHKKKINSIIRKREGIANYFSEITNSTEPEANSENNVRNKEVDLVIMSVEEAITQMEMLDHDFYMFINEDNHKTTLVYIRKDGGYGVIEPK